MANIQHIDVSIALEPGFSSKNRLALKNITRQSSGLWRKLKKLRTKSTLSLSLTTLGVNGCAVMVQNARNIRNILPKGGEVDGSG